MIRILLLLCFYTFAHAITNDYSLEVILNKKNIYLGESVKMALKFSYKNAEDYRLKDVKIAYFTVKELDFFDYKENNNTFVEKTNYLLTPQKSGLFTLGDFIMDVEVLTKEYKDFDNRSKYTKKFSISSDSVKLHVQKLPNNISVLGEYTIDASVDKHKVSAGEVVTLTLNLQGIGNIKNLDTLNLHIPNATSYLVMSAKSSKKHLFSKTFEIIADESYTIPPFELHYFDKNLNIVRTTQSKSFFIELDNTCKTQTQSNHFKIINKKSHTFYIEILSGLFLILMYMFYKINVRGKKTTFLSSLKNTKSQDKLYKKLVVHLGKNSELDELIYLLESKDTSHYKQNKHLVMKLVKRNFTEKQP